MEIKKIKNKTDLHQSLHHLGYKFGVEVGAYRGSGTESLLLESKLDRVWAIDYWAHPRKSDLSNYEDYISCINRLFKYGQRCTPLKMEAKEAASFFAGDSICYVYIDAGLECEEYLSIAKAWWPKVKPDGMIAGRLFDWVVTSGKMVETDASFLAVKAFSDFVGIDHHIIYDRPLPEGVDVENYKGSRSWFIQKK